MIMKMTTRMTTRTFRPEETNSCHGTLAQSVKPDDLSRRSWCGDGTTKVNGEHGTGGQGGCGLVLADSGHQDHGNLSSS